MVKHNTNYAKNSTSNTEEHLSWHWKFTIILCSLSLLAITGCVGIHVDEYGARIGSETIERYTTEDQSTDVCNPSGRITVG